VQSLNFRWTTSPKTKPSKNIRLGPSGVPPSPPPPTPVGGLRNGHRMALELVSGTDFGCALHFCTVFLAKLVPNAWPQPYARIDQPATNMTNMLAQSATKARGSSIAPSHRPKRSGWRCTLARQWLCAEASRSDQDANKANSRKTSFRQNLSKPTWQCCPCPPHQMLCKAPLLPLAPERPSQCGRDAFASGQGRQHCSRSGLHNVAAMLSQAAKGGTAKNATGAAFTVLPRCFRKRPRAATLQPQRPSQCGRDAFASGQGRQHPHCASEALRHCGAHGLPKSLRCRTALLGRGSGGPKDQRPHE